MKSILLLLIIFINCHVVHSQENEISIEMLELLASMNSSEFEDWVLKNDYEFEKVEHKYEYFDIIYYIKKGRNCIGFATYKNGTRFGSIQYQTRNSTVYTRLKSDCSKKGYKYINSDPHNFSQGERIIHKYKKDRYKIEFNTSNKEEYYGFSIGISLNKNEDINSK